MSKIHVFIVTCFNSMVGLALISRSFGVFHSAAASLAMQSAVLATAVPSVRQTVYPFVPYTLVLYPDE